jgi:hypothetical protein
MNELLDSIEKVVVGAATRRARRRHRARVTLLAVAGLLLLASAASAVTGAGPIGAALHSDPVLPEGAQRDRGEPSVRVGVTAADGRDWELLVYRKRYGGRPGFRGTPGGHDYCLAAVRETPRGARRWRGVSCGTSMEIALDVRDGLLTHCGAGGLIDGQPQPMGPVCGLVPANATSVEVTPSGFPTQRAQLSDPLVLTIDRSGRPLRHHRIDPQKMRAFPRRMRVRAFLMVPDVPPIVPGAKEPDLEIVASGPDGWRRTETRKGYALPTPAQLAPDLPDSPPPGAPRVTVGAGARGDRWTVTGFASPPGPSLPRGTVCVTAHHSSYPPGPGGQSCAGSELRLEGLDRFGIGDTGSGSKSYPLKGDSYAIYGFVRADAKRLRVRDRGKTVRAHLSRGTLAIERDLTGIGGAYRARLEKLPKLMRARAFVAVLRGKPGGVPERRVGFAVELRDGRVIRSAPPEAGR